MVGLFTCTAGLPARPTFWNVWVDPVLIEEQTGDGIEPLGGPLPPPLWPGATYTRSSRATVPCPPSAHTEAIARVPAGFGVSSLTAWLRIRAPVAANG